MWKCTIVSLKDNGIGTKGKEGEYMKAWRRGIACVTAVAMLVCGMSFVETQAASTIKLSTSKVTLTVGKTTRIRVKNYKKKVIWSSAKKSVAAVTSVGKYVGRVKAKKAGSTKIYAKCGTKKLICKVTVKKQTTSKNNEQNVSSATATIKPTTTPTRKVTAKPDTSVNANQKYLADQSLEYDEEDRMYHLYFSIKLSDNQTRKEYAGNVALEVYNSQQELVYNQSKSFAADDFFIEEKDGEADSDEEVHGGAECLCDVEIPASEFVPGKSSEGILYYSISLEDDTWFSKRTLDIDHLPVIATEKTEETIAPIVTKTPGIKPTATVKAETPEPTREPVTKEPEKTVLPTKEPTINPSATPEISKAPTATPMPTETVKPTNTPVSTETPIPTETIAVTATPTATETLTPTETPGPTETVKPKETPTITPTITPTPEVPQTRDEVLEESMETLCNYIIINGEIDSNGDFYLEWDSEDGVWQCEIACNLMTNDIVYSISGSINGYDTVLVMESSPFTNAHSILKCSCVSETSNESGKAILSFENVSYTKFASKNFYVMGDIADNEIQNIANILWYSGMQAWNSKLDYMNLSLKQLGYDNYGNTKRETVDTKYPIDVDTTTTTDTLERWKQYIQSIGEETEEEVYRIYMKDGENIYFVSYDSSSGLFNYGMKKQDGSVSLNITVNPDLQSFSTIVYENVEQGTVYGAVDVSDLTGTEQLSFWAEEKADWVEQLEQDANVCLWKCYANWSCLAQCVGLTLNNVGFDRYGM